MRLWDSVKAAASGVEDDGTYDRPHSAENSAARRAAAFQVTAADLGLSADWGSKPFGVIIERLGPHGLSTLTAYANGAASILSEDGSGVIGRPNHVHVVREAKRLVARAEGAVPLLSPTPKPSRPAPGSTRIYVFTDQSLLSADVAELKKGGGANLLTSLMDVAEELLSELAQYALPDTIDAAPPKLRDHLKSLAIVAILAGVTYAAWLIPIAWIRWPLVAIGLFFTAAALFVFYAMLVSTPGERDEPDEGGAAGAQ